MQNNTRSVSAHEKAEIQFMAGMVVFMIGGVIIALPFYIFVRLPAKILLYIVGFALCGKYDAKVNVRNSVFKLRQGNNK